MRRHHQILLLSLLFVLVSAFKLTASADSLTISFQSLTTVKAGETIIGKGTLKQQNASLPTYTGNINWTWTDTSGQNPNSCCVPVGKDTLRVTPIKAYTSILIRAAYPVPGGAILRDSVWITVLPGDADHLTIESDSVPDKWTPNRKGTVTIGAGENTASANAVLRDRFDNFVRLANAVTWSSRDITTATATGQNAPRTWYGTITRATQAEKQTYVLATDNSVPTRPDSVLVNIASWYPVALRLVKKGTDSVITTLTLNTDQSIEIEVQGQQSNDLTKCTPVDPAWLVVPGPDALTSSPAWPTRRTSSTVYSPLNPGKATLRLTYPDTRTPVLNIPMIISPARPSKATMTILTPADSLVAGAPFRVRITIDNKDGPVPGQFWFVKDSTGEVKIWDPLGYGGKTTPTVTGPQGGANVNAGPGGNSTFPFCFTNGEAVVQVTLYYAPFNKDSVHQLFGQLDTLFPRTDPFVLNPGAITPGGLNSLRLESSSGTSLDSTITLKFPYDAVSIFAVGYDAYGNKIGNQRANWTPTATTPSGTLHAVSPSDNVYRIYYDATTVTGNESGIIRAVAVGYPSIADEVPVVITGPATLITRAITRDMNTDGYLDRIEVRFERNVTIPANFQVGTSVIVKDPATGLTFQIDSISGRGTTDSVFLIHLHENSSRGLQTGWHPTLAISGIPDVQEYSGAGVMQCVDGAPPVVSKVVKTIGATRAEDKVEVTLSEPVRSSGHDPFTLTAVPSTLFMVYTRDQSGAFTALPSMLNGITSLTETRMDSILVFVMSNGADLASSHYLNIRTTAGMSDLDTNNITLNPDNRHVGVCIQGVSTLDPLPRAITRDMDGDGYLDAIMLYFKSLITLPDSCKKNIDVTSGRSFITDSLRGRNSTTDSVYILYLHEDSTITTNPIQTGLTPFITIRLPEIPAGDGLLRAEDGAGPVIWKVTKEIKSSTDRTQDEVTVYFSEKVMKGDGQSITPLDTAASLFRVFKKTAGASVPDPTMLSGIISLLEISGDSVVKFRMTNNANITAQNQFDINPTSRITDQTNVNPALSINRKVSVLVIGETPPANSSDRNCGGCGTGLGLAFLPPIGFKAGSAWNRRRKVRSGN